MFLVFAKFELGFFFHRHLVTSFEVVPRLLHEGLFFGFGEGDLLSLGLPFLFGPPMLLCLLLGQELNALSIALLHFNTLRFDFLLELRVHLRRLLQESFMVGSPLFVFATVVFKALALFARGFLSGELILRCGLVSFLLDHLGLFDRDLTAFLLLRIRAFLGFHGASVLGLSALLVLQQGGPLFFLVFLFDCLAMELGFKHFFDLLLLLKLHAVERTAL